MSQPDATAHPSVAAILLAGGSGSRMRGAVQDKVLQTLAGQPVLAHSVAAFQASRAVDTLVVVYRDSAQRAAIEPLLAHCHLAVLWTPGGAQRQDSVHAGLAALPPTTAIVLVHDAARPLVTPEAIRRSIAAARSGVAACLARPVADTIKSVEPRPGGRFAPSSLDRSRLWAMETPQTLPVPLLRDAYRSVIASGRSITDDLSAIEDSGLPVEFIDNGRPNPKITTPEDLAYVEFLLLQYATPSLLR